MKRKNNRRKSKLSIYVIIGICFLFLFVIGTIYAQVSQTLIFTGTVRLKQTAENIDVSIKQDECKTEGGTEEKPIIRYYYTYTITNNTKQGISSWKVLVSNMPKTAIQIAEWSHDIAKNDIENGKVIFQNKSWNSYIEPGNSVTVTFSFIANEMIDINRLKITIYTGTVDPEEPEIEELTGLTLNPNTASIKVGDTVSLTVQKTPTTASANLTWSSSDEKIAKVSQSGVVTAISEGTAVITVSSGNISANCNVTVEKEDVIIDTKDVKVKFELTNYWANSMQFRITISNNLTTDIQFTSFKVGVPEGSSYTIWSDGCSNTGNNITCTKTISSGESYEIYGQIDIPEGYDINEYLTPTISGIEVH